MGVILGVVIKNDNNVMVIIRLITTYTISRVKFKNQKKNHQFYYYCCLFSTNYYY